MTDAAGRVVLVPLEPRHSAQTLQWTNDRELARLLDRPRIVTEQEHERWFATLADRDDTIYFAIERDGRHVGNVWLAGIDARHRKAEVRIVLASDAAGQGTGSRAIELIAEHAFGAMNLHRLYAFVLAFNPRARRAFEKAHFTVEGTLRDDRVDGSGFVDTFVLGRVRPLPT
jgi:RimJ/RimL family protein N-acetyltransferase